MNVRIEIVGLAAVLVALAACGKNEPGAKSAVKVTADENGYSPASVTIPKGQATVLEVTRTTDRTCAREIVLPELGITKELPLDTPVTITLPAGEPRTYAFQCGMGMFKGSVVVQ